MHRVNGRGDAIGTAIDVEADGGTGVMPLFTRNTRFLVVLVLVAFALRAIAAIALHELSISQGRDGFYFGDDRTYDLIAWQQAQGWLGTGPGLSSYFQDRMTTYTYTEAVLYVVIGHHPLAMKLLNCLLGALTAGLVFLIAWRLFGSWPGIFAGVLAAVFPSTFLWSLTNMKDTMFVFGTALLFWLLTEILVTGSYRLVLPLLATYLALGSLRWELMLPLGILAPGSVMLQSRSNLPQKWQIALVLAFGCAALLWIGGGAKYLSKTLEQWIAMRNADSFGANSAFIPTGGVSDEGQPGDGSAIIDLVAWLPTGLANSLAAPFPWAADRAIERATIPEMILWYAVVALAVSAIVRHWRLWRKYVHLLGYITGMLLLFALVQGNLGMLFRHRSMIIPFVLVFSGERASWLWLRWRVRRLAQRRAKADTFTSLLSPAITLVEISGQDTAGASQGRSVHAPAVSQEATGGRAS